MQEKLSWHNEKRRVDDLIKNPEKLSVSLAEPLVVIKKMAPGAMMINRRFGPAKNVDDIRVLRALYAKNSVRGAIGEVIRTVFERKNDMTIYIPDLRVIAMA